MRLTIKIKLKYYKIKFVMSNRKERKPLPYNSNHYLNMREQGSPTKASVLLQEDHAEYIQSLQNRKQNFCTCLDLYKVSYQNEMPQKCLIHNNFITLYCQNQFKLLCVNCIYGSAIHKDHRVVPSKNSVSQISRDNQDNLRILDEQLQKIKHISFQMGKNKKVYEEQYKLILKQIDEQFKLMHQMIDRKHRQTRQKVVDSFSRAANVNQIGSREISWWREMLIKTRADFPKSSINEDSQVYKHLVLDLFKNEKIDEEKLTYLPSGQQIRTEFLRQVEQLRQAIEQQVGPTYQTQKSNKIRMF